MLVVRQEGEGEGEGGGYIYVSGVRITPSDKLASVISAEHFRASERGCR